MSEPPASYERTTSSSQEALPYWAFRGINQQPCYHGVISQEIAEEILGYNVGNWYLVRYDREKASFMISVATSQADGHNFKHFLITVIDYKEYELKGTGKRFHFISQLLKFYLERENNEMDDSKEDDDINSLQKHKYEYLRKLDVKLGKCSAEELAFPTRKIQGIGTHPSFHGVMTAEEAEKVLKKHSATCFLTRYSKDKSCFRLSVITKKVIQHFSILMEERIYEVKGAEMKFDDIHELLSFYENTPLTFEVMGIGKCVLREDADQLPQPYKKDQFTEINESLPTLNPKVSIIQFSPHHYFC